MSNIPWSYRLYRLTWSGMDLLFPPVCAGCGKTGSRWCLDCQSRVPRVNEPFCTKCGIPMNGADICEKCNLNPPPFRMMRSWAVFDPPIQNALHSIKYRRNIGLADAIAVQLVEFVHSLKWDVHAVIPAPLGAVRLKERGYNQVALVTQPLAHEIGVTYAPEGLRKIRETRSQVGLNISARHENTSHAYRADPSIVKLKSVLLVDDVATTGATVASCTEALLYAGAAQVYVLTVARALSHHDLNRV